MELDQRYTFRAEIDIASNTFAYYVDDVLIVDDASFESANSSLDTLGFMIEVYDVDNVSVRVPDE